jgi:hypothetical protein
VKIITGVAITMLNGIKKSPIPKNEGRDLIGIIDCLIPKA